jgi:hypothetical protein
MATYFVRHTLDLDIDDDTRRALWEARKIAIHFPWDKSALSSTTLEEEFVKAPIGVTSISRVATRESISSVPPFWFLSFNVLAGVPGSLA